MKLFRKFRRNFKSCRSPHRREPRGGRLREVEILETRVMPLASALPSSISNLPVLHSDSGATKVIYLDFVGYLNAGGFLGSAGEIYSPFNRPGFAGGALTFTGAEAAAITVMWKKVAEDFRPFQVDVTTVDPGVPTLAANGQRMVVTADSPGWAGGAAGISVLGSFGGGSDDPDYSLGVTTADANDMEDQVASHELGHAFGLGHDGTNAGGGGSYYFGHGDGTLFTPEYWNANMGGAFFLGTDYVTQWTMGQYFDGNNPEDDLAIIAAKAPFRTDDLGNTTGTASLVNIVSSTSINYTAASSPVAEPYSGIIERNTDVDYFTFTVIGTGTVTIHVDPVTPGPNCQTRAKLYNSVGTLLSDPNNPAGKTNLASLGTTISQSLSPGVYYISVEGNGYTGATSVASGFGGPYDPSSATRTWWTKYGSVGAYIFSGTASAGATFTGPPPPSLAINNVTLVEGNSGTTNFVFTVTQSAISGSTTTVQFTTTNGSALISDGDYTSTSGTLTIAAGLTSGTITVAVTGDNKLEGDETFTVNLSSPSNATIATGTGTGTITNDDVPPTLSINNVTLAEGNAGTTNFVFTVTQSSISGLATTFSYTTADGSATTGDSDYVAKSGTLTIAAGSTTGTITVTGNGDTKLEANETFTLSLSSPGNATIASGTGTGTITNDDAPPTLVIGNVALVEGNGGTTSFIFTVTQSAVSGLTTTVNYTTADGTALVTDGDYITKSGALTFNSGVTTQTITVTVNGDTKFETNETFTVNLSGPANATVATGTGTGTITNDDAIPTVSIANVTQAEGNGGSSSFLFNVTLSNVSSQTVTVNYATANGTATTADSDYVSTSGTLTFNSGITAQTISVTVNGDTTLENDETFTVTLSNPTNGTLGTATGTGTIQNDDSPPTLGISDVSLAEGNSGSTNFIFTVALSSISGQTTTVNFSTADGTATTATNDYLANSGALTFTPGQTSQTVTVSVTGDATFEADETFLLNLSGAVGATLADSQGVGTILNDDLGPLIINGDGNDNLITITATGANSGFYVIDGGAPIAFTLADSITVLGLGGNDTLTVNDNGVFGSPLTQITFDGGAGNDQLDLTQDTNLTVTDGGVTRGTGVPILLIGVEQVNLTGGAGDNILDASAFTGDVTLSGGAGNDTLLGGAGNDLLDGGLGVDSLNGGGGTNTVQDADNPTISITGGSILEGGFGSTLLNFSVSLSSAFAAPVTVNWATADGTALAGSDYVANSGLISFAPGQTSATVSAAILGDYIPENNEDFSVVLSSPTNSSLSVGLGDGQILNDDTAVVGLANIASEGATGDLTTLALKGGGVISVVSLYDPDGNGLGPIQVGMTGTGLTSSLSVKIKKGTSGNGLVDFGGLQSNGGLKSFSTKKVNLVGDGIHLGGYLAALTLRDILNGADVVASGAPTQFTKITAHVIGDDTTIDLGSAIKSLSAASVGRGQILAPSIGSITIKGDTKLAISGDFGADVTLSGAGVLAGKNTLGKVTVKNIFHDAWISVNGNVGAVKFGSVQVNHGGVNFGIMAKAIASVVDSATGFLVKNPTTPFDQNETDFHVESN